MVDTPRTISYLTGAAFSDGQAAGSITPQDMRDFIVTAQIRTQGIRVTDPEYGADPTGVTECSAAINAAAAAAKAANVPLIGVGTFKIGNTVTLGDIDVDLSAATFNWVKTFPLASETPCILLSEASGTKIIFHRTIRLPKVIQEVRNASPDKAWWVVNGASNDIGIQTYSVEACYVYVPYITGFSIGLAFDGTNSSGTVYNTVFIGEIIHNMINMRAKSLDQAGWSNSNVYLGGSFQYFESETVENQAGTRHVYMPANPLGVPGGATSIPNSNVFLGNSFENKTPEYYIEAHGDHNIWTCNRWELQGNVNPIRVLWTDSTACHANRLVNCLGPDAGSIVHVQSNGAAGNGSNDVYHNEVLTSESCTGATIQDLATFGPSVSVWVGPGDVIDIMALVDVQGDGTNNARVYLVGTSYGTQLIMSRSTATSVTMMPIVNNANGAAQSPSDLITGWISYFIGGSSPSIQTITLRYGSTGSGTATFANRRLWVRVTRPTTY